MNRPVLVSVCISGHDPSHVPAIVDALFAHVPGREADLTLPSDRDPVIRLGWTPLRIESSLQKIRRELEKAVVAANGDLPCIVELIQVRPLPEA